MDILPSEWTDTVRWLSRRLNSGELRGVRFGRTWRMRPADIDFMLSKYSNDQVVDHQESEVASPQPSFADSLSPRSRARLRRIQ